MEAGESSDPQKGASGLRLKLLAAIADSKVSGKDDSGMRGERKEERSATEPQCSAGFIGALH